MKLTFALALAATLAFVMPVCATPNFDDAPLADFGQMPSITDLQDEWEDENSQIANAREERNTADPGSSTGGSSIVVTPQQLSSFAAAAINPIPEPSTALLLAPAAALFLLSRRRR